ncbi:hypothetical protein ACFWHW_31715 [Streptomyces pharetrae]|uniref:hypothetical protein n=1 Tax=Streptomyces pharetrae TaxID=291370 RepID=UPI00364C4BD8
MASVTEDRDTASVDSLPIDVEMISETIDLVWGMQLSTSTRKDINARTGELVGHLNLLVGQCFNEDESQETLRLLRMVERHVAMSNRPTRHAPAHDAYAYMRDSAVFASALLSAYQKASGVTEG